MTRKIFYGIIALLIFGMFFTAFAVVLAQEKTNLWDEFEVVETPATPSSGEAVETIVKQEVIEKTPAWLITLSAVGVGLGVLVLLAFFGLQRRLAQIARHVGYPPPVVEDEIQLENEPEEGDQNRQNGGNGLQNTLLLIFGAGILALSLAFGPLAYAQPATPALTKKTVTLKSAVQLNQKRIISLKGDVDSLKLEIQRLSDKMDKMTPSTTTPTTPGKGTPKKGKKPATTTTATGLTEAKVRSVIRSEIRSRAVELPKIAKKGWATKKEKEIAGLQKEIASLRKELASVKKSIQAEARARAEGDQAVEARIPPPFDADAFGRSLATFLANNGFVTHDQLSAKADQAEVDDLQDQVSDLEAEVATKARSAEVDAVKNSLQGAEESIGQLAETLALLARTRGKGTKVSQPPLLPFLGVNPKFKEGDEATRAAQKAARVAEEIAAKYARLK